MALKIGTAGHDLLIGTVGDDLLIGLGGHDALFGSNGNDTLDGGPDADTLGGGSGNDVYYVDNVGDRVLEAKGGGSDVVYATTSWTATAGAEIESLYAASTGAISLTGNAHGLDYSMLIYGNAANNTLSDGGGLSDLYGGYGNDTYVVTNVGTVVHEFDGSEGASPGHNPDGVAPAAVSGLAEGYDTVRTDLGLYQLPDNVEALSYFGAGDFIGIGNAQSNMITGGAGNDTLDGGAGADRLVGGRGDDTYAVDDVRDAVVEQRGGGVDTINVSASAYVVQPNVEKMFYVGDGNFAGFGNDTGDTIVGGLGNDYLQGGKGADLLYGGGGGADILRGGDGADSFLLTPPLPGVSRIMDFHTGVDKIVLQDSKFVADYGLYSGPESALSIQDGTPNEYFTYDGKSGALFLHAQAQDDGPYAVRLIATLDNHPVLTAADFHPGFSLIELFPLGL